MDFFDDFKRVFVKGFFGVVFDIFKILDELGAKCVKLAIKLGIFKRKKIGFFKMSLLSSVRLSFKSSMLDCKIGSHERSVWDNLPLRVCESLVFNITQTA